MQTTDEIQRGESSCRLGHKWQKTSMVSVVFYSANGVFTFARIKAMSVQWLGAFDGVRECPSKWKRWVTQITRALWGPILWPPNCKMHRKHIFSNKIPIRFYKLVHQPMMAPISNERKIFGCGTQLILSCFSFVDISILNWFLWFKHLGKGVCLCKSKIINLFIHQIL